MVDLKVKILHIITRLDKGGSAENTMLTVLGLARQGYEIELVHGHPRESAMSDLEQQALDSSLEEAVSHGVKTAMIPSLVRRINPLQDLLAFWAIFKLIRKEKPRIVHTHTSKAGIHGRLAAWFAGVPLILHTPHGHVFYGHFGKLMTTFFILLERVFASFTNKIITLTERGTEEHLEFGVGRREQFVAIPSGIDLERLYARSKDPSVGKAQLGLSPACLLVGSVGKIVTIKGYPTLVSAAAEVIRAFPSVHFVIVGEGPMESELQRQVKMLSLQDHVHFVKAWGEEAWAWIASFDLFVLPSLNEGMGRVLIEAMALAKPVVASQVGGIPEIVVDGETGILVPPKDAKRLAEAILYLLKDKELCRRMGEAGKKKADSRFSA
ncbi:MAG: glycosyltransferase family 4 protein, partial [Nitrospiria bacterium]